MSAALPASASNARTGDLSIGDLAAATVSRDGLRFTSTRSDPRRDAAAMVTVLTRPRAVELVQYVRTAQQLGFTLAKLAKG
ncbi:hypothetical protein ACRAWF_09020 [Streptomyces sp. L7]